MPVNEVWVFRRENFVGGVESEKVYQYGGKKIKGVAKASL